MIPDSTNNGGNGGDSSSNNLTNFQSVNGLENIFPPTINLDKIEFNSPENEQTLVEVGKLPFIWFNDIQINSIESFYLRTTTFLPTLSITFLDSYGFFDNLRFANDDDRVKIFIDSKDPLLKPIYIEFKILKFRKVDEKLFSLEGIMNINRMLMTKLESFGNSTSFEVMKKVATLSNLGFTTNVNNTNDIMTWINPGSRVFEFCKDVIRRSYRSDSSFMFGFVDVYYNLNFIDVESQIKFDLSKQTGILSGDLNEVKRKLSLEDQTDDLFIYLSNDGSSQGTSNYIEFYKVFNNSTTNSIKNGYVSKLKYYNWVDKSFLEFDIEAITNDDNLILKSDDEDFLSENISYKWGGKIIKDNAHENYHYSQIQNELNLNELQKIGLEVILPLPNYNLHRFMKIYVMLINQGMREINPPYNAKLSGEWLVTDIQYFISNSVLKQKVRLMRRDLGFSQEEEESGN